MTIPDRTDIETTVLLVAVGVTVTEIAVWGHRQYAAAGSLTGQVCEQLPRLLQGRFLLTPGPRTRPSLEQRLVAVALADQAGAALAGPRR